MTTKKTVLWCCILALLLSPGVVHRFWGKPLVVTQEPDHPVIRASELITVHEGRIKERVELLRGQTLEETFAYLWNGQQYYDPGFHTEEQGAPQHLEQLLSSRGFLKTFQQFGELPREKAIEKLPLFCEEAIKKFEDSLKNALFRRENPSLPPPPISINGSKYMVYTTMLLAARMGENKLLLYQIDKMQPIIDDFVGRINVLEPEWADINRGVVSMEEDCIFSILMYALQRKGTDLKTVMPDTMTQKTIPLYRWDAAVTHYDFLESGDLFIDFPKIGDFCASEFCLFFQTISFLEE